MGGEELPCSFRVEPIRVGDQLESLTDRLTAQGGGHALVQIRRVTAQPLRANDAASGLLGLDFDARASTP